MSETEQVKSEDSQPIIKPEVKPKNPKRVEAGKKGAEARRLKKMQQPVTKVTTPIVDCPTSEKPIENPIKINVYKTYLPACLTMIGIAGLMLYVYKNKPVQKVSEVVETDAQSEHDPFEF